MHIHKLHKFLHKFAFTLYESLLLLLAPESHLIIYLQTVVDLKLGLFIEHGESNYFIMKVQNSYKGKLCGICGDYNGDPGNDWTSGPRCNEGNEITLVGIICAVIYSLCIHYIYIHYK